MQELISQIAALGIKITPTTSLIITFGIIFLTAIVVHLILHKVVLRTFEKRAQATIYGCKSSRKINSFTAWRSPYRELSSTFRPCSGCRKAAKRRKSYLPARNCGSWFTPCSLSSRCWT